MKEIAQDLFKQTLYLTILIKIGLMFFNCKVVQKKRSILFFIPKLCFTIFFHIFQVVETAGLGDSFDTNMDPTR